MAVVHSAAVSLHFYFPSSCFSTLWRLFTARLQWDKRRLNGDHFHSQNITIVFTSPTAQQGQTSTTSGSDQSSGMENTGLMKKRLLSNKISLDLCGLLGVI